MEKIYKNSSKFRLTLRFNEDISLASTFIIKYIKPDLTTGQWTATLSGTTDIYFDMSIVSPGVSQLNQSGQWKWWGHITWPDGRWLPSSVIEEWVYEEGE
jgi:hypothetical protein